MQRIILQGWEVPVTLAKINENLLQVNALIAETNDMIKGVAKSQEEMISICENHQAKAVT